jgi:hypothetical protein
LILDQAHTGNLTASEPPNFELENTPAEMRYPALSGLLSHAITLVAALLTPRTCGAIAGKTRKANYLFKLI